MFNLKLWYKNPIIEFYCHPDYFDFLPKPVPASKKIADWYKKIPTILPPNLPRRHPTGARGLTAKKCMPMLDAMSLGFTIPLGADVNIRTNKDRSLIEAGINNDSEWVSYITSSGRRIFSRSTITTYKIY